MGRFGTQTPRDMRMARSRTVPLGRRVGSLNGPLPPARQLVEPLLQVVLPLAAVLDRAVELFPLRTVRRFRLVDKREQAGDVFLHAFLGVDRLGEKLGRVEGVGSRLSGVD